MKRSSTHLILLLLAACTLHTTGTVLAMDMDDEEESSSQASETDAMVQERSRELKMLLSYVQPAPSKTAESGLVNTVERKTLGEVERLIRAGANLEEEEGADAITALFVAAERKDGVQIVESLLQAGAHPNRPNRLNFTPIIRAAQMGNEATVKRLLHAIYDRYSRYRSTENYSNFCDGICRSLALAHDHAASENIRILIATEMLKSYGLATIETKRTTDTSRPLRIHWGIDGFLPPRNHLLPREEPIKLTVTRAVDSKGQNIVDAEKGPSITPTVRGMTIWNAARTNDAEAIEKLCAMGALPNQIVRTKTGGYHPNSAVYGGGSLPLVIASMHNNEDAVNALLKGGADPDLASLQTPLAVASAWGYTAVVRSLLKAGANPNLPNEIKETPLGNAEHFDRTEVATMLREAGAKRSSPPH